jgi:hypothetical protein
MPKGVSQVVFECPEEFRRRLYEEKLKRRISIKRLIIDAVEERWFSRSSGGEPSIIVTLGRAYDSPEKAHWADMFVRFMECSPSPKVRLLQDVIKEDLKLYRSKRRAASPKKRRGNSSSKP